MSCSLSLLNNFNIDCTTFESISIFKILGPVKFKKITVFPSFEHYKQDGLRVKSNNRHTVINDHKPYHFMPECYFLFIERGPDDGKWKPWEIALLVVGVLALVALIVTGAVSVWRKLKPG